MMLPQLLLACAGPVSGPDTGSPSAVAPLVVATFNTGTSPEQDHDAPPDDGYGEAEAALSDTWYGDGLAWVAAIEDVGRLLDGADVDVIAFQELFYAGDCPTIPAEATAGFVCEGWQVGDPLVTDLILGPDYQVACNLGKTDKCLAVHRRVGEIRGCDGAMCLDGLDGAEVSGCGSGSRIGRAFVDLVDGGVLTVVAVHGTSGFSPDDAQCRTAQFELVFDDLDGEPAAVGEHALVLGDFNTDPGRLTASDSSAALLADRVDGVDLRFHTEVGPNAPPTYLVANIDHVISRGFEGACEHPLPEAVTDVRLFDHRPAICTLRSAPCDLHPAICTLRPFE